MVSFRVCTLTYLLPSIPPNWSFLLEEFSSLYLAREAIPTSSYHTLWSPRCNRLRSGWCLAVVPGVSWSHTKDSRHNEHEAAARRKRRKGTRWYCWPYLCCLRILSSKTPKVTSVNCSPYSSKIISFSPTFHLCSCFSSSPFVPPEKYWTHFLFLFTLQNPSLPIA